MNQPKDKTEAPKDTGPSVQAMDAWNHSFEIAKGLWDLLSIGCRSDEGFTPEGLRVLEVAAQQLINEMNIVNSFFNPEEQE